MPTVSVVVNLSDDERVIQIISDALRKNDNRSKQIRDFADTIDKDQFPLGLKFQPRPGNVLVCHFGISFEKPENIKTRPVLVISTRRHDSTRLCIVVPISSKPPHTVMPYHYQLPTGIVPSRKYAQAWIKGDMVVSVGLDRLDRIKTGFRKFESPMVPDAVLREARRCVLHAAGMHALTPHW